MEIYYMAHSKSFLNLIQDDSIAVTISFASNSFSPFKANKIDHCTISAF